MSTSSALADCDVQTLLRSTAETLGALRIALNALSGQTAPLDLNAAITFAFEIVGNQVERRSRRRRKKC